METLEQAERRRKRREHKFQRVLGGIWLPVSAAQGIKVNIKSLDRSTKKACFPEKGSLGWKTHYFPHKDTFGEYMGLLPDGRDADDWAVHMQEAGVQGNYFPCLKAAEKIDEGRFVIQGLMGFENGLFKDDNERSMLVQHYPNRDE
jgi:hypothetical protein